MKEMTIKIGSGTMTKGTGTSEVGHKAMRMDRLLLGGKDMDSRSRAVIANIEGAISYGLGLSGHWLVVLCCR